MSVQPEDKFTGTAYVVRIKDPNNNLSIHKKPDFLHAIAYNDPKESFDYMQLKSLIEANNKLILYSYTINKRDRSTFTWKQCLDALTIHKPTGDVCFVFHDKPVSFGNLAKLAYEHNVLHDSVSYNELLATLNPKPTQNFPEPSGPASARSLDAPCSEEEAVRRGIQQAKALRGDEIFVDDTGVASNIVANDKNAEHTMMSMEYWRARALAAEEQNSILVKDNDGKELALTNLKNELAACGNAKQRFAAQADLASARLNDHKVASAEPFIEAIKPQIACLPVIQNSLKELLDKVVALGDVPNVLKGVYEELFSLSQRVKESEDASEAMQSSDTESIICIVERLSKILAHFGITTSAPKLDLPKAVADIGLDVRQGHRGGRHDGVHGFYTCECGCGEMMYGIDITKPPPSSNVPAAPSTPVPTVTPTAPASSTPSRPSNHTAPCPPGASVLTPSPSPGLAAPSTTASTYDLSGPKAPNQSKKTDEKAHSAANLPYPVQDTFLQNYHHVKTTFLLDPANNIAPQGYLMHHQQTQPQHNASNPISNVPANNKRANDANGDGLHAKKQC